MLRVGLRKLWHSFFTNFRKRVVLFFCCLILLFNWKQFLGIVIQVAVRSQIGCGVAYRSLSVTSRGIALSNPIFFDLGAPTSYFYAQMEELSVSFFPLEIVVKSPHCVFLEGSSNRLKELTASSKPKKEARILIENGSFEWKKQLRKEPLFGRFSYSTEEGFHVSVGNGALHVLSYPGGKEDRIVCELVNWDLGTFSEEFQNYASGEIRGELTGSLHISLEQHLLHKCCGKLIAKDFSLDLLEEGKLGARELKWEGEYSPLDRSCGSLETLFSGLRDQQRMTLSFEDGFFFRRQTYLSSLSGKISHNRGVGTQWEIGSPDLAWRGKEFASSLTNWGESRFQWGDTHLFVRGEKTGLESTYWTVEMQAEDASFVQFLEDVSPIAWPISLQKGSLRGRFEWEMKGCQVEHWKASSLCFQNGWLKGANWELGCERAEGTITQKGVLLSGVDAEICLEGGRGSFFSVPLESWKGSCDIRSGRIETARAEGRLNQLACCLEGSGFLSKSEMKAKIRGNWGDFCSPIIEGFQLFSPERSCCPNLYFQEVEAIASLQGRDNQFQWGIHFPFSLEETLSASGFLELGKEGGWDFSRSAFEAKNISLSRMACFLENQSLEGVAQVQGKWEQKQLSIEITASELEVRWENGHLTVPELIQLQAYWDREKNTWNAKTDRCVGMCEWKGERVPFDAHFMLDKHHFNASISQGDWRGFLFSADCFVSLEDKIPFSLFAHSIEGEVSALESLIFLPKIFEGQIQVGEGGLQLKGDLCALPTEWEWKAEAEFKNIKSSWLEKGAFQIGGSSEKGLLKLSQVEGNIVLGSGRFPLRCIKLQRSGDMWPFDLRMEHQVWDLVRLVGAVKKTDRGFEVYLDEKKAHILGSGLATKECVFSSDGSFSRLQVCSTLDWTSLLAASNCLNEMGLCIDSLTPLEMEGGIEWACDIQKNCASSIQLNGRNLKWAGQDIPCHLRLIEQPLGWRVDSFQCAELSGSCSISQDGDRWRLKHGILEWGTGLQMGFHGIIDSLLHLQANIPSLCLNLGEKQFPLCDPSWMGALKGRGTLSLQWQEGLTYHADFDFLDPQLQLGDLKIENQGPVHLQICSEEGLVIRGVQSQVKCPGSNDLSVYGKVELMRYDFQKSCWFLHQSQVQLPSSFFVFARDRFEKHLPSSIWNALDPHRDVEFFADLCLAADGSFFSCAMSDAFFPLFGLGYYLKKAHFSWQQPYCRAQLYMVGEECSAQIELEAQVEEKSIGRLSIRSLDSERHPLIVDWDFEPQRGLWIHSIEGSFSGIEAAFHAETLGKTAELIGSMRLSFDQIAQASPSEMAKALYQLKLGKGYEFKGRIAYDPTDLFSFSLKGLLSGKQCECFGMQIRTLLSQIEVHPKLVRLFNLKGSDSAGTLKIDQLKMYQKDAEPWRLEIPLLSLKEFRPSLLQKIGQEVGPVGPFVLRDLKLIDLQGKLGDSQSLVAKGTVSFINSFKREHTVFDIPSDFLGRIFGLDLELLIPVRGDLSLELKEGRLWFTDLVDSYSQGKRSKFFLVHTGNSPSIDLQGNISILVKMKQYVLLKITEAFLLSIEGTLENPSYHLQKKRAQTQASNPPTYQNN